MYLAGDETYRILTDRVSFVTLEPTTPVIGPGPAGSFDNGGAWLYSAFRQQGDERIGFYHAEDWEWPAGLNFIAWKSVALATSSDNGASWAKHGQILTGSEMKPEEATWGGNGDFSVIYDHVRERWTAFYANHFIKMAISEDPAALPGTWFKRAADGTFSEPGLGGQGAPVPGLEGHPGGNPSVHFNSFVGKWIMIWHTWHGALPWSGSLWISASADLLQWETPILVVPRDAQCAHVWYPTIAGTTDTLAGHAADLSYACFPDSSSNLRDFVTRTIQFDVAAGVGGDRLVLKQGTAPTSRTLRVRSDPNMDLGAGNGSSDDPVASSPQLYRDSFTALLSPLSTASQLARRSSRYVSVTPS